MTVVEISWNLVDGVAAVWYKKMKHTQNVYIYFVDEWTNRRTNERTFKWIEQQLGFGFRLLLCVIAKDATKASLRFSITALVTFLLVEVAKPLW